MTVEYGISQPPVAHEPPPPPFSLKTSLSGPELKQIESPETEVLAQIIEQVHPERSAFATVRQRIEASRYAIRPNQLINEADPYAVIALETFVPGLQEGKILVPRTLKKKDEARIEEVNTREFVWLNNEMPDLYVPYLGVVDLEELRLLTKLSQEEIGKAVDILIPKWLDALDSDPEFSKAAGPNWKKEGLSPRDAFQKDLRWKDAHVSYFGSIPQGGPLSHLAIGDPRDPTERTVLEKGNPQSKSESCKLSMVLYWDINGKLFRNNVGAVEGSEKLLEAYLEK